MVAPPDISEKLVLVAENWNGVDMSYARLRSACAELFGTAGLSFAVLGGVHLSADLGDSPAASLISVVPVATAIAVVLAALGPLSGGHINPAISLSLFVSRHLDRTRLVLYAISQVVGALIGAAVANWIWSADLVDLGSGTVTWQILCVEAFATFGLIAAIHGCVRGGNADRLWLIVPGYVVIVGFAAPFWVLNPALVVALSLGGGAWSGPSALALVGTECAAAIIAAVSLRLLYGKGEQAPSGNEASHPAGVSGTAVFELAFQVPPSQQQAVAAVVAQVADRLHRPIDFVVRDAAGRVLLAVDSADEDVLSSLERRLNDHVALALMASGLPPTSVGMVPTIPAGTSLV